MEPAVALGLLRPPDQPILDALDAGIVVVAQGRITRANAYARRVLRADHDEVVGKEIASVMAPVPHLLKAASEGRAEAERRAEIAIRRPDGSHATIGLSVSTFEDEGVICHCILFRDISTVVELRRQRDRLLQIAALADVLPSVLHELRNPLAAVTSMLEVIVEETSGDLQTDLHSLLWELRRMSLNLHGVSGIARPLRAKAYAAIDHAVREACRVLEATAACKGVNVLCEVDDLPLLPLDRGALSGIVFNLVTNAIDACSRGNQVIVRLSLDETGALSLSVRDDGKGMKPETLARCCELFFTEKDGGTGIGLALCKEAIAAAGGSLDIRSTLGDGTTVNVSIPFTQHDRRR